MKRTVVAGLLIVVILLAAGTWYLFSMANQSNSSSNSTMTITPTISPTTSLPQPSWDYQGLASAVTNSSEVKSHVTNAYYVFIMRYGPTSSSNGTQLFADVYIIGAQSVTGNWTTGYTVTYTGRQILNVTVQWTTPSTYNVTGVTITNLTNQTSQGSFDATQKQAIGVALANSTVKSDISGMDYFVSFADPQINDSVSGYWVLINQINGYRSIAILVNSGLTEVSEVVVSTSYPNFGAP